MIEEIEVVFWNLFNKTASIYMITILVGSILGGNISSISVWGIGLISGIIALFDVLFFIKLFKGISYFSKVALHCVACFITFIFVSSLIGINDVLAWSFWQWARIITVYISIYGIFTYFYMLKHRNEVRYLNKCLNEFKKRVNED